MGLLDLGREQRHGRGETRHREARRGALPPLDQALGVEPTDGRPHIALRPAHPGASASSSAPSHRLATRNIARRTSVSTLMGRTLARY